MSESRVAIQFCGFGGQGVVLSSIILGSAAVVGADMYAVQTQSYGSEARGGECQAELIIDRDPVGSPVADQVDILVAMSQMAYNRYVGRLRPGGMLILDPQMVTVQPRQEIIVYEVPAVRIAEEAGSKIAANMVMLGFLQQVTGLVSAEQLMEAIEANVRASFLQLDQEAAKQGMVLASEQYRTGVA